MSRYLTPSKISLLVLISLYCESVVPNSATISILSFIASRLIPSTPTNSSGGSLSFSQGLSISIEDFENVTVTHASSIPGRTLFDLFLKKLWAINSLHALHAFFDSLGDLLVKRPDTQGEESPPPPDHISLSRTSPLGTFVRRSQLEFTRLQFHDAVKLWMAYLKYKEPTAATWRKRNPIATPSGFDINIQDLRLRPGDELFHVAYGGLDDDGHLEAMVSTDDVERILEFQVEQLQRYGNRVPDDMKEQFQKMVTPSVTVPSLSHFVKFFDAWRAGDYTSAFDNLHRYFDYTMQTRDKTYYQYALLHMAILQADFGCFGEAVAAMNETITTARENQDMSCLNFSLSWLNHLGKAYPKEMKGTGYGSMLGSERDGIHFLKMKAKESKMWSLLSSTLLSEAKLGLSSGDSVARAFEHIYQSSHLNIRENIASNIGAQMLVQSSLYGRLGLTHLSNVYCELLLHCYSVNSPVEEGLRALCRLAYAGAQAGRYDEAFHMLESMDPSVHRTLKFHQYLTSYSGLLKLKRALRRTDMVAASHLLRQLQAGGSSDPELSYQTALLEIDFLTRSGSFSAAYSKLEDLAEQLAAEDADIYQRVHLLTLKAFLFAKVGKPAKGFSVAMRAASTAHRARILPALWESVGAVANVLVNLEEFGAAIRLLDAVIPQALEGNDYALCAQLYSIQADGHMGQAGKEKKAGSRQWTLSVSKAEIFVDRCWECYRKIQDVRGECEMLAKKAMIAQLRGEEKAAEDWAAKYMDVWNRSQQEVREQEGVGRAGSG